MDPDDCWDGSVAANTLRQHPQHHDHDSDDENNSTTIREIHSYDDNERSYGGRRVLRRPAAIVRVSSDSSGGVLTDDNIGFHQGQETRHRLSPLVTNRVNASKNGNNNASRRPPNKQQQHHMKGTTTVRGGGHKKRFGKMIRLFVAIGGLSYLLLMVMLLSQQAPIDIPYPITRPPPLYTWLSRNAADQKSTESRRNAEAQAKDRAARRRQETRPPSSAQAANTKRYEFLLADDKRRLDSPSRKKKRSTPARLEDLCGTHAKEASLQHPNSFLAGDALNSKARVMITGVLNPVGFRLALTLKERCGVQVMTGIDPMYPNTLSHRLDLLERMQILATVIPKLLQPIVLPLLGLNPRVNKKQAKTKQPMMLPSTGEVNLLNFHPTHVVHLASFSPDEYRDGSAAREKRVNVNSPYISSNNLFPPLYQMRSSMVSMEHILASIASEDMPNARPHFTYASSMGVVGQEEDEQLHSRVKLVDEVLADTYRMIKGVASVGLRFPRSIYGPWGRPGTPVYDLAEATIQSWNNQSFNENDLLESLNLTDVAQDERDFVFVDDVVDAIIAAMQYRPESSSPALFNVGSKSVASLNTAAKIMENLKPAGNRDVAFEALTRNIDSSPVFQPTRDFLGWSPTTPLTEGITKLLAWHLDKAAPFGPPNERSGTKDAAVKNSGILPPDETGDAFLTRNDAPTCPFDDVLCQSGDTVLPCVSECSSKENCAPSVFDPIADLVREVTEGCDVVLYTQNLGHDVADLDLESEYMEEGKRIVCNFAFIPQESRLAKSVVKKVPASELGKFGIPVKPNSVDAKLDGLNGRLLYKGWILMWVKDAMGPLSTADEFLLKMSPGKLFAPCVTHAMYVADNFPVTPNVQDVLFLADETHRSARKQKSVYRNEEDGKKHKYVLEAEPERRAVMLTAPLRQMVVSGKYESKQKISITEATKYMTFEIGGDPMAPSSPSLRKQREFYDRIASFSNRLDMRSPFEPFFRFAMKHWIRTRWIVHDLKVEEGRQLRCAWYKEHVRWGNDVDQLSFAYVMQMRELRRRIANKEPDDRTKKEEHPEMKELTDAHEWHALVGEQSSDELATENGADKSVASAEVTSGSVPPYMRIMSERFMLLARYAWAKKHGRKDKKKK